MGRVLSRERTFVQGADAVRLRGRQYGLFRLREKLTDPAWSETPSTHASSSYGNREIPRLAIADGAVVRAVNSMKHDGNVRLREVGQFHST